VSDPHARRFLLLLVALAVVLAAAVVRPFWQSLFLAAVLAATFRRPMEWLAARLGGRRAAAAGLLTLALVLLLVLPLAGLGAVLVPEIAAGVQWVRSVVEGEGVRGLLGRLPEALRYVIDQVLRLVPEPGAALRSLAVPGGGQAAVAVGGLLARTGSLVFRTALMLIAFFFLLTDGARLVSWLDASLPLRPGQLRTLLGDFRRTSLSVLAATLGTAAIQSVVALAGYLVVGAPNPVFLVLATFVLALIPAVGASVVMIAVALLLVATGHSLGGAFLVVWAAAAVSIVDNVARPWLLKGGLALHGGLVFFSLLGGLAVFGGVGLVAGPLVLTFLVEVTALYRRELESPEEAGPATPSA
jgi:predicted PurR-regulated permease PerM